MELLAGGVGLIAKAVGEFQSVFNETANMIVPPDSAVEPVDQFDFPPPSLMAETDDFQFAYPSSEVKEIKPMYDDCDQGNNDDLKYVSYSIVFRKRDFEATLRSEKHEVIDYPLSTFCNLKVADYLKKLATGKEEFPNEWENGGHPSGDYGYQPTAKNPKKFSQIPAAEQKWIECVARVEKQVEKAEKEYDKAQAEAAQKQAQRQDEIVEALNKIERKI